MIRGWFYKDIQCSACKGTGMVEFFSQKLARQITKKCKSCNGTGHI